MTDRTPEDMSMPDDLRSLDAELSSIRYEERPSFRPELRAELAREWAAMPRYRPSGLRRNLVAAAMAGLLVGGAAVPSARASFIRLIGALNPEPIEIEPPVRGDEPVEAVVQDEEVPVEIVVEDVTPEPVVAPVTVTTAPEVDTDPLLVMPEMVDRQRSRRLLREAYPLYLQRQGVGGTVWVHLWIDETGIPGGADVQRSSGVPALDRVALRVVPRFTFAPALQDGRPTGTWIQFPVSFEPDSAVVRRELRPAVDPLSLPTVDRDDWWELRDPLDVAALPEVGVGEVVEAADRADAAASLAEVFSDPAVIAEYGPTDAILRGQPSDDRAPTEWRSVVGAALQGTIDQGTDNPAAMLAYGRIRARQGLHTEARTLFERGLQLALRDDGQTGSWVVAELHYERGSIVRDSWMASNGLGRVRSDAFGDVECTQARSSGGGGVGFSSVERLIAWNYLCPNELTDVMSRGFSALNNGSAGDLTLMMASLRAAVEAYPAHIGANTDLLVTLATEERWGDVLSGARRFTRVSGGHANGLLLAGLALHRLDRSAEAADLFRAALGRMSDGEADELSDVGFLLDEHELVWYRGLASAERRAWETDFWKSKDRTPATEVNERWVEHMARTTYARLRLGGVFGDAGEVWVRFGGPKNIHIVDEGSGRLTEFWDYGSGPDITFVRWVESKRTDLTPEGRAYVDDLGKIFPPQ
jgi:TonB family protein